jgi:hypothetical protein
MAIDTNTGQVSIFPIWSGLIVPIQVHELDFSRYQMGYVSMESQKRKDYIYTKRSLSTLAQALSDNNSFLRQQIEFLYSLRLETTLEEYLLQ